MTGRFISKAVGGEHESPRPLAATLPRCLVAGYAARCYDEVDCWGRSSTALGSSLNWTPTASLSGILSSDCSNNPDFCNFNRVWLVYCDGACVHLSGHLSCTPNTRFTPYHAMSMRKIGIGNSFSGNRDDPVPVVGLDKKVKPLYFRGRRIIDETLRALSQVRRLSSACLIAVMSTPLPVLGTSGCPPPPPLAYYRVPQGTIGYHRVL